MCDTKGNWLNNLMFGDILNTFGFNKYTYKKALKKDQAAIAAAEETAKNSPKVQAQAEANKLANSTQTTEEQKAIEKSKALNTKKVPLNTSSTGLAIGNGTSIGLNLGGY